MKSIFLFVLSGLLVVSCKKDDVKPTPKPPVPVPEVEYIDLQNFAVMRGASKAVDVDKNGDTDIFFATLLVGDPLFHEDKLQFFSMGAVSTYFLMSEDDKSPIFENNDIIPIANKPGYTWFEISFINHAEKVSVPTGPSFWRGLWKDVNHKFLGFQLKRNNKLYNGWVELSFDMQGEKLILHRSALSKIAEKDIVAGK